MQRGTYIERVLRLIYSGYVTDDSEITVGMVNNILPDAIASAAKQNYKEAIAIDGIAYVNGSFYTTYKDISPVYDEKYLWKVELPEIPVGIGENFGISTMVLKDSAKNQTYPLIPITQNQKTYFQTMRTIPNKTLFYYENKFAYIVSTLMLNQYTTTVTMISGGDASDLDSELNVPADYYELMDKYLITKLAGSRLQLKDQTNDGADTVTR